MNMMYDLQKAGLWKRVGAGLFDWILTTIAAVGFAALVAFLLHFDSYDQMLNDSYAKYESEYGVTFNISQEEYQSMSEDDRQSYDDAYDALLDDKEAMYAYNMMVNLSLLVTTAGILLGVMLMEFFVPLLFGNGRTLGKRIFSIALMRTDGVKISTLQLFIRTLLGKFVIESMIPVYIILMIFWGITGITGTILLLVLLVAQCIIIICTRTNSLIHDLLAGSVVIEMNSQMIFNSTDDLIAYQKKIAAERAAQQTY